MTELFDFNLYIPFNKCLNLVKKYLNLNMGVS
jgi:hypothetical protein